MTKAPDRAYRAVLLRADEAAQLTRDSQGQFHPAIRNHCCPHLDIFHNRGQREDGSHWKVCSFLSCQCDGEDTANDPLIVARREYDRLVRKSDRRDVAQAWWFFGAAVGAIIGALLTGAFA